MTTIANDVTINEPLKISKVLCFSDGSITVKLSGYGSLDGSGRIAFDEETLDREGHDDGPGCTRFQNLPETELIAIRDFLNRALRSTPMGFHALRAANAQRSREWQSSDEFNAMFYAVATGGECGEALNVMKKLERDRIDAKGPKGARPSSATLEDLAHEMADTIIYMDLWADSMGIDLWKAIVAKFNHKSKEMGFVTRLA